MPILGKWFQFAIPYANYVNESKFTWRQRYDWAVLDTFDMLSPTYDMPQKQADVERYLKEESVAKIQRLNNGGLNLIGIKAG